MNDWIMKMAEELRAEIRKGPFFRRLKEYQSLTWVQPLRYHSIEFTHALGMRWAMCPAGSPFRSVYAEHAAEEAEHPQQLDEWMAAESLSHNLVHEMAYVSRHTVILGAFCLYAALRCPDYVGVPVLNVLSEGVALDFYTAVIPVLERRDRLSKASRYWRVHRAVDGDHLEMGMHQLGQLYREIGMHTPMGCMIRDAMVRAADLYQAAETSWSELMGSAD